MAVLMGTASNKLSVWSCISPWSPEFRRFDVGGDGHRCCCALVKCSTGIQSTDRTARSMADMQQACFDAGHVLSSAAAAFSRQAQSFAEAKKYNG